MVLPELTADVAPLEAEYADDPLLPHRPPLSRRSEQAQVREAWLVPAP